MMTICACAGVRVCLFGSSRMTTGLTRDRQPTVMAIVPPILSRASCLEVLIATSDNSVLIVDDKNSEDQMLQERISSPIVKMSVAPQGRFLACFTRDGILTVKHGLLVDRLMYSLLNNNCV